MNIMFLTGSRAYGKPTDKSDIDVVAIMSPELCDYLFEESEDELDRTVRFGKLNIICLPDNDYGHGQYKIWKEATDDLIKRKPVTRQEAVEALKKAGVDGNEYDGEIDFSDVIEGQPEKKDEEPF